MNKEELQEKYTQALEVANKRFEEIQELKDRIQKAIEYIEKQEDYFNDYPLINRQELLDILKGEE